MKHLIHKINLWRLKRMMTKSARLNTKISQLGAKLDRWERLNIDLDLWINNK